MFAELASHFPVAGSIYQWSRRLISNGYGWFAGWAYMWTLVIAMATVALGAAGFMASIFGMDAPTPAQKATIAFVILLPFAWRNLHRFGAPADKGAHAGLFAWTATTVPVWCLLMFEGNQTVIHQGSYAMMLGAFTLLSAWFQLAGRHWLPAVATAQAFGMLLTC